jgi:dinuclear metal center YbgI/SA1388 family protein
MLLKEITSFLDSAIPLSFQENWDNSGLQVGNFDKDISSALVTIDVTREVIDEALAKGCNLIISHHPLIFNGIKQLTGRNFTERMLLTALKNDIAVYSAHTNLDIAGNGVSMKMAEKLGLKNLKPLIPLRNKLSKLVVFIPESNLEKVREAIFAAGAGFIGLYDKCSFTAEGTGSFRAGEGTNPFVGEKGKLHFEKEVRLETVIFSHSKGRIIKALLDSHPYEEPAYDIYALENDIPGAGLGCVGDLTDPVPEKRFLEMLAGIFSAEGIKYSQLTGNGIKKVALCGGAGGQYITDAISSGADAYVSADIRYHSYFEAADKILIADIGHFESEKFSTEILYDLIIKKFPTFAVRFSAVNTNPINYF